MLLKYSMDFINMKFLLNMMKNYVLVKLKEKNLSKFIPLVKSAKFLMLNQVLGPKDLNLPISKKLISHTEMH